MRGSAAFPPDVMAEIQRAANEGLYQIRGFGTLRKLPSFDDLVLLGASMSRYPLEGYRERCGTDIVLGTRFAKKPIELKIPITSAGMSFAAISALPRGIDQRSACRHPDWTGPDDLTIKIEELREATDWEKPVFVKIGSARPRYDVQLAVKAGADVVVLDGMQGGTAATQDVFIEHAGIPTLPALRQAVEALQELGMHRKVQLVISGGIRSGADVAKAMAMGAEAVSICPAALIALDCNRPIPEAEYRALGTAPGYCHHCHTGRCPVGITTQDPALEERLVVAEGARKVRNYLTVLTLEAQTLARARGKSHLLNLQPEALAALPLEAAAMGRVPPAAR